VAAASAGASGSGSLTMASGFTLYAYTYSVQFSQPVRLFEIDFKRRNESVTSVTAPAGFRCTHGKRDGREPYLYCSSSAWKTTAHELLTGTVYLKNHLTPGEGAILEGRTLGGAAGPFSMTGP
jgi:hypothetical protein